MVPGIPPGALLQQSRGPARQHHSGENASWPAIRSALRKPGSRGSPHNPPDTSEATPRSATRNAPPAQAACVLTRTGPPPQKPAVAALKQRAAKAVLGETCVSVCETPVRESNVRGDAPLAGSEPSPNDADAPKPCSAVDTNKATPLSVAGRVRASWSRVQPGSAPQNPAQPAFARLASVRTKHPRPGLMQPSFKQLAFARRYLAQLRSLTPKTPPPNPAQAQRATSQAAPPEPEVALPELKPADLAQPRSVEPEPAQSGTAQSNAVNPVPPLNPELALCPAANRNSCAQPYLITRPAPEPTAPEPACIHVIGDSHSRAFSSSSDPKCVVHWVGPKTMFGLRKPTAVNGAPLDACSLGAVAGEGALFVFGEIDVRVHIGRVRDREKRTLEDIVADLVEHYLNAVERSAQKGVRCAVAAVLPPSEKGLNASYPFYGSLGERVEIQRVLNQHLRAACKERGLLFLDYVDFYANSDGSLNHAFSDGHVHIRSQHAQHALKMLRELFKKTAR